MEQVTGCNSCNQDVLIELHIHGLFTAEQ